MVDEKIFLVRYNHEGREWGLEIMARDFEDAETRLSRISYGSVDGELICKVPALAGPVASIVVWLRNLFFQR